MDKISNLRLFAFLDENRRKILENLDKERTFDELKTLCGGTNTALAENLKNLQKAGLIKEKTNFIKNALQKDIMKKKFIRSF